MRWIVVSVSFIFPWTAGLTLKPLRETSKVTVNYAPANEYMAAHYGNKQSSQQPYYQHPYFVEPTKEHTVYDARVGVQTQSRVPFSDGVNPATLHSCGFTLLCEPGIESCVKERT
jgi:hypothetical protein